MITPVTFASIPSPGDNSIHLGPLEFRAYGVMIALGAIIALEFARRRWSERGGDPDDIGAIALWALPAGLAGARLYHVITDWHRFEGRWWHAFAVWEGGLGIPGGLLAGVVAGIYVARRRGLPVPQLLDVVAPAIPIAQAIGRFGNWFNQELFGGPTDLPWGLEIDPRHRPDAFADAATFHPTFLYEALWNVGLVLVLLAVERRWHPRPGQLFAGYVAGYSLGRLWVEAVRVDPATEILGVRVNIWVSAVTLFVAVAVILYRRRSGRPSVPRGPARTGGDADGERHERSDGGHDDEQSLPEAEAVQAKAEEPGGARHG